MSPCNTDDRHKTRCLLADGCLLTVKVSRCGLGLCNFETETSEDRVGLRSIECYLSKRRLQWAGAVMRRDWDVRLHRKLFSSWLCHQRPNGRPVLNFGRNLKRDLLRIELSVQPLLVVFPENIAPHSLPREVKRLLRSPILELPRAQIW
jgi:hypothetical protein